MFDAVAGERALTSTIAPDVYYWFVYPPRALGMGLAGLSAGSVLYELHASLWAWIFLLFTAFVWPHIAYLHSRSSQDTVAAEKQNLFLDSIFIGLWLPLMHFSPLPSVVIPMITTLDKSYTVYPRLWLHSLLALLGSALLFGSVLMAPPKFETSTLVVLCTIPLMFFYTWFNSYRGARLLSVVTRQNWAFDQQRRTDPQSGLSARAHWMECAEEIFKRAFVSGKPPCLLLIDVDRFKSINDTYGHTVGDEVICEVGRVVHECVRQGDIAGRFGGDEFVVIVEHAGYEEAYDIAERIRNDIANLRLISAETLQVTGSIGLALVSDRHANLRAWIEEADAALYRAKHTGRNRVSLANDENRSLT
ncbi:sensor domain-containing diguanylate cyclase [Acidihalobacter aeolianus]|nr:sensor domain-containing diguanylate cyclase [Acidihalobacter aeolianus]